MSHNNLESTQTHREIEDVFGAYLLKGSKYDLKSGHDIPFVNTPSDLSMPDKLIEYSKSQYCDDRENAYLHFYQKDYIFDGPMGIWYSLLYDRNYQKGFSFEKLDGYKAIITPDFSLYYDMPDIMQMWNILRSRIVGYYLTTLGYNVVINVRWTDEESYDYCFAGISKNSIVAVSTLGCLRSNADKSLFLPGLEELIKRLSPKTIILYGSLSEDVKDILDRYNQKYVFFPSEVSTTHGGYR